MNRADYVWIALLYLILAYAFVSCDVQAMEITEEGVFLTHEEAQNIEDSLQALDDENELLRKALEREMDKAKPKLVCS